MGKNKKELPESIAGIGLIGGIGGLIGNLLKKEGDKMFGMTPDKKEIAKGVLDLVFSDYEHEIDKLHKHHIELHEKLNKTDVALGTAMDKIESLEDQLAKAKEALAKKPKKKKR